MKLRWIDLGRVNPSLGISTWEYSRLHNIKEPTLIGYIYNTKGIDVGNLKPLDKTLNVKDIPEDYSIQRFYSPTPNKYGVGSAIWDENMLWYTLHLPKDNVNPSYIMKQLSLSLAEVLRNLKIPCIQRGNDVMISIDNKLKKCSGYMWEEWNTSYVFSIFITFKINIEDINLLIRKDTDKFTKKINFNGDIGEVVCGLWDINKDLTIEEMDNLYTKTISKRLELELYKDTLTNNELSKLKTLALGLDTNEWKYNAIHPELGDVLIDE